MTTKFFIIAFLFYPWSVEDKPHLVINKAIYFNEYSQCIYVLEENREGLQESVLSKYPMATEAHLNCMDLETANKMRREIIDEEDT